MNNYSIHIEIPKGRLTTIFKKLDRAQDMIRECYKELESLGVVKFKEESSQEADSLSFKCDQMADIQFHDVETKIAFLKKRANAENIEISNEVLAYIANRVANSPFELEGALSRVVAYSDISGENISINSVADALKDVYPESTKHNK